MHGVDSRAARDCQRPGGRTSRRRVRPPRQRGLRQLQADQVRAPGGEVRRGRSPLRHRCRASRDAEAREPLARRARGNNARGHPSGRCSRCRARADGVLRRARPRPRARGRSSARRCPGTRGGADRRRPEVPRGHLALLQSRRLRRHPVRQQGGRRDPPRVRRSRGIHEGSGRLDGDRTCLEGRASRGRARSREDARAHPADRADTLGAHRNVLDIPKEGLMKKHAWLPLVVSLALLGWLAPDAYAQKVVKIGDLGSKVGVFEGYGKYQTMAIQMAVEELNAKGGVLGHKIEIISEDDETKPAPAFRKAEKLVLKADVKRLIGAVSSGATLAVMDVTKKHRVVHWNSVSCAEFMRTTKFHKYYFSNQPDSRMQANGLAKYIVDKMGKKVYIFYTDYAMGQSDGRQFKTALEKLGGEVVGVAGAPLDTKDFSPWFGAINSAGADVLFLAFAGTDSLRLMTQLHSFGMTKKYKLAGIDCFLLQQDLPAIAEPMEGFVQLNHFSAFNPDPAMQSFNQKFKKRWNLDANIAAGAYDAVLFWAAAVEKAKSFDPDKVAEAHEGMCLDNTHIGRQCIRKDDHQVVMDMHLYQVKGGKNVPIARIAGHDSIGEPMVGKDPVAGFTWEIKKKN